MLTADLLAHYTKGTWSAFPADPPILCLRISTPLTLFHYPREKYFFSFPSQYYFTIVHDHFYIFRSRRLPFSTKYSAYCKGLLKRFGYELCRHSPENAVLGVSQERTTQLGCQKRSI